MARRPAARIFSGRDVQETRSRDGATALRRRRWLLQSAKLEDIRAHGHVLTPGRYVGAADIEDDGEPFEEKMKRLTATLEEQFAESAKLEKVIWQNLKGIGYVQ